MAASDRVGALLLRIAEDEATPAPVRLAAIKDVLDRAGVTSKQEIEVTVQPWQQIIEGIVAEVGDGDVRTVGTLARVGGEDVVDAEWQDGPLVLDAQPLDDPDDVPTLGRPQRVLPTAEAEPRIPSRRRRGGRAVGR